MELSNPNLEMNKNNPNNMSEYGKLLHMISLFKKVLHPDVFNPIQEQLYKCYEEAKVEALENAKKELNISDLAIEIEKKLIEAKNDIAKYKEHPTIANFHARIF